ncbi:dUTP diphosphatase [Kocuria massiliensis]|uniref:dUTP diphosphatase n=1 Tax=Kocuria massiliensis TaxID=1926282 RepID=UPI0022B95674|nr:dUTP diphosphatase [Kocuria massiliensis]
MNKKKALRRALAVVNLAVVVNRAVRRTWLPVKRESKIAFLPDRKHAADAGLDLHSAAGTTRIPSGERRLVPTGISVSIPRGYVGMVVPRSGLAHKQGVTVFNAPGIVDSGYTGEVMVNLYNTGSDVVTLHFGDRIAQLVIVPIITPMPREVNELRASERGAGGHGSTGR